MNWSCAYFNNKPHNISAVIENIEEPSDNVHFSFQSPIWCKSFESHMQLYNTTVQLSFAGVQEKQALETWSGWRCCWLLRFDVWLVIIWKVAGSTTLNHKSECGLELSRHEQCQPSSLHQTPSNTKHKSSLPNKATEEHVDNVHLSIIINTMP